MEDGLPVTTKTRNKKYHGFGMRSMRQLAEKYGGSMYTQIENGVFILQIVLPMPKEFLRLMKEESIKHEEM
jgi:sensor histidine kinase regulating citrate/malate metabolism